MTIPFFILITKYRVETFHRRLNLFHTHFGEQLTEETLPELMRILGEFSSHCDPRWVSASEPIAQAFHRAVSWANTRPYPPADVLQEARQAIDGAISLWLEACTLAGKMLRTQNSHFPWAGRVQESVSYSFAQQRWIKRVIDEGWPVESAADEQRALEEMKSGNVLELDDAFARIAGVLPQEWQQRVEEHKRRHKPQDNRG